MHSALISENSALPTVTPVRPMLMLTGFLGAGKTTLLRAILDDLASHDHLADVILNDRENAFIDRETLKDHTDSISALTGSCVCCEGLDELCDYVLKASKTSRELLFIELNGTADPLPLQEIFTLLESTFLLQPRWQVCVVDARHFGKRESFRDLEALQLESASHYVLSHLSEISAEEEQELRETVQRINSVATPTTVAHLSEQLRQAMTNNQRYAITKAKPKGSFGLSHHLKPESPSSPHLHDRHELAHQFTGCNIVFPHAVEESRIIPWLKKLPASIIRVKALLTHSLDSKRRHLYERVGLEISPNPIPVSSIAKVPCSGIFIGPEIDPHAILQLTQETLHPDCHFPER